MSRIIWGAILLFCSIGFNNAHAARTESGNTNVVYFDGDGKKISALDADKLATMDKPVLGCQPMEKVCNERTGKCTLKKSK